MKKKIKITIGCIITLTCHYRYHIFLKLNEWETISKNEYVTISNMRNLLFKPKTYRKQ